MSPARDEVTLLRRIVERMDDGWEVFYDKVNVAHDIDFSAARHLFYERGGFSEPMPLDEAFAYLRATGAPEVDRSTETARRVVAAFMP